MARISIDEIKSSLSADGWTLVSEKYVNLDSNLEYLCEKGHVVCAPWKQIRKDRICPTCMRERLKVKENNHKKKKSEYRVLALDQATHHTGYAVFNNKDLIDYGVFEAKGTNEIERCAQVKQWMISMIETYEIDFVGIEQIQLDVQKSAPTFEALAHLQGILMLTCYEEKIPCKAAHVSTWRAHCGVRGKTRPDVKRSCQLLVKKWFGIMPTDDEADAIGIGKYFSDIQAPKVEIIDWEAEG